MQKIIIMILPLIIFVNLYQIPFDVNDLNYIRVTCYTWTGNPTASGVYPEEGMCAGRREDMGKTAYLFDRQFNYVGEFEITDTGGASSIQNGTSIDVFRSDISGCYSWVREYGDYLYVYIE